MSIRLTNEIVALTKLRHRLGVALERLAYASDNGQYARTGYEAGKLEELGEQLITLAGSIDEKATRAEADSQ